MVSDMVGSDGHLPATDARTDVAHAIVVANMLVLIVGISFTRLSGIEHNLILAFGIGADERSATAGGNHLIAVERQHAVAAKCAAHLPGIAAAEAFSGIFHHRNTVFVSHSHHLAQLGWHTIEVDRHNGFRLLACDGNAVGNGTVEQFRVNVPSVGFAIDEHRRCAKILYWVARRAKGETLANHFVARPHAQRNERQMHRSRTSRQRHHVFAFAHKLLKVSLKAVDIRAQWHHPIVGKCLLNIFHFVAAHVSKAQ